MSRKRSHATRARLQRLTRGAIAASAAAAALLPAAARAEDGSFGGGAFLGYRFGSGSHFEWGLEAFGTRLFESQACSSDERAGAGAFAQIAWLGLHTPRITLAAHAGGELQRTSAALSGELGATYRFGPEGGFGIHTGVMAESLFFNAAARYQWLLNEAFVGGGIRVFGTYGVPASCAVGRPLRTDGGLLALHAQPGAMLDGAHAANAGARIEAVGRAFERDAQLEFASIPAFLQLASELAELEAPASLVARALQAARDEKRHTALCAGLAMRHLEDCAAPALPDLKQRAPIAGRAGLVRLAIESWVDGCVAEGRAAAQAARASELATDAEAERVQRTIAADELRHAELAWSILRFALAAGGEEAHAAVRGLRDIAAGDACLEFAPDGLQAHGRLDAAAMQAVADAHLSASRKSLDALLAQTMI